jgi:Cys-rich protein (TIGR01571 family)
MMDLISGIAFMVIGAIIFVIFAMQYKSGVLDKRQPFPAAAQVPAQYNLAQGKDFAFGICDCFGNCQACMHGCCCPSVSAGDRYDITKVNKYWSVVGILVFFYVAGQVIAVVLGMIVTEVLAPDDVSLDRLPYDQVAQYIVGFFQALWLASQRQKLRSALGGDPSGQFLMDWLLMWLCSCCTITQEARQVDAVQGVQVNCCCSLTSFQAVGQVGQPVYMGGEAPVAAQAVVIGSAPPVVQGTVVQGTVAVESNEPKAA